jgi:hypothetical protein
MPTTFSSSTAVEPIAVNLKDGSRISGLSKHKLREAVNAGDVDARKHGSQTLLILESLRDYIAGVPSYQPNTPTPESAAMIAARKRLAAEQRARGRPRKVLVPAE